MVAIVPSPCTRYFTRASATTPAVGRTLPQLAPIGSTNGPQPDIADGLDVRQFGLGRRNLAAQRAPKKRLTRAAHSIDDAPLKGQRWVRRQSTYRINARRAFTAMKVTLMDGFRSRAVGVAQKLGFLGRDHC